MDEAAEPLVQRLMRGRQVLDVGGARVAGADEDEHPGPGLRGGGDQRLHCVETEQRVGGESVGAEPGDRAPRRRGLADQGLGVGGGGDRDVAALTVGDDQQSGFAGDRADVGQRRPSRCAEALEAGELGLDRDAGGAGSFDQGAAVGDDRGGGQLGGQRAGTGGHRPLPGQLGRIGVEAEADLTATLVDERRQPIGEQRQEISRP